jgi:hypothetical protein
LKDLAEIAIDNLFLKYNGSIEALIDKGLMTGTVIQDPNVVNEFN